MELRRRPHKSSRPQWHKAHRSVTLWIVLGMMMIQALGGLAYTEGEEPMQDNTIQRTSPVQPGSGHQEIWLAGGCFWGMEKYLDGVHGVVQTDVGYANGHVENPTYQQVCAHTTGYAETVRVVYDPQVVSLPFLLDLYYKAIDPTSVNRQGGDVGDQYRTGIYYTQEADAPVVEASLKALAGTLDAPVAVEAMPLQNYYLAEETHQKYLEKNPGGYCHVTDEMCAVARTAREYVKPDDATLREQLTDLEYRVTQENVTEPPYDNAYDMHFERGIYVDVTTGQPLFVSTDKFDSGCGWPAFSKPIDEAAVKQNADTSYGLSRMEVRSEAGDAHLGHVFEDGPEETGGLRYCINSAALRFVPEAEMMAEGYGDLLPLVK